MAMINCPECNKQISSTADSCPNCGHSLHKVERVSTETIVTPLPERREESFPKWAIVPLVLLGVIVIFGLIYMLQNNNDTDRSNINVNIGTQPGTSTQTQDIPVQQSDPNLNDMPVRDTTVVPETTNDQTIKPDTQTVVGDTNSDKGKVELEAKVSDSKGNIEVVKAEKFYLLDKDLESILSEAKLNSIQNQSMVNSFGLSVLYPGKYSEFNKKALSAINDHIKYDTLTDSNGKAQISGVKPDNYYLFGIHKVGQGFAVWSSPVTITGGTNNLNIQPQRATEFAQ